MHVQGKEMRKSEEAGSCGGDVNGQRMLSVKTVHTNDAVLVGQEEDL